MDVCIYVRTYVCMDVSKRNSIIFQVYRRVLIQRGSEKDSNVTDSPALIDVTDQLKHEEVKREQEENLAEDNKEIYDDLIQFYNIVSCMLLFEIF